MGVVNGAQRDIFKDPVTDDGLKKSAKGLLHVTDDLELIDQVSSELESTGALKTVFLNGKVIGNTAFDDIRNRLRK